MAILLTFLMLLGFCLVGEILIASGVDRSIIVALFAGVFPVVGMIAQIHIIHLFKLNVRE